MALKLQDVPVSPKQQRDVFYRRHYAMMSNPNLICGTCSTLRDKAMNSTQHSYVKGKVM
jgi:hypothetical protein